MEAMGNKSRSKEIMTEAGVPCIPGYHGKTQDPDFLLAEADKIGFPVLLKAVKGGGGKGMRIAMTPDVFYDQLKSAKSEAMSSFGDEVMLVEKYIQVPRHIEVQVFADKYGNCVALGERDCSIQRRHQKILEESPAPNLDESVRQDLYQKARAAALAVGYEGAGTVEFIFDNETGEFFFMEMNTRLQVEHAVTEMVTGEDLVRWQIIVAEGGELPMNQAQVEAEIAQRGHAIEARIYAENPDMDFIPDSGKLIHLQTPKTTDDVRIDAGFVAGDEVSSHYDPMIAKLIVRGSNRARSPHQNARRPLRLRSRRRNHQHRIPQTRRHRPRLRSRRRRNRLHQKARRYPLRPLPHPPRTLRPSSPRRLLHRRPLPKHAPPPLNPPTGLQLLPPIPHLHLPPSSLPPPSSTTLSPTQSPIPIPLTITPHPSDTYTIHLPNTSHTYTNLSSTYDPTTRTLSTFFPHTRLTTRFIHDPSDQATLTLFQQGHLHRLTLFPPNWAAKALGVKEALNSVLAPMPCKVHSVEVAAGDRVAKGQVLVVIESMKMETAIRSPVDGVVRRVVHGRGDLCRAGTALVEFEDEEGGA